MKDISKIKINKSAVERLKKNYPWIYSSQVSSVQGKPAVNAVVAVSDYRGGVLGYGYYNPKSTIAVRMLSFNRDIVPDDQWLMNKIDDAIRYRHNVVAQYERQRGIPESDSLRLVHGDADGIPGLYIDKYGSVQSIQATTAFIDSRIDAIAAHLCQVSDPDVIVFRNDASARKYEGLPLKKEIYNNRAQVREEDLHAITAFFGKIPCRVDVWDGHKTGMYLDQRANWYLPRNFYKGKKILDAFCYTGMFSRVALEFGAAEVTAIDSSEVSAAQLAPLAAKDARFIFRKENVFDFFGANKNERDVYDMIILDPPSFTKSKNAAEGAYRGYREINSRALKMLKPGGLLFTFTCSYHFAMSDFNEMLGESSHLAGVSLRLVAPAEQSPDHPVCPAVPETNYLKGGLYVAEK